MAQIACVLFDMDGVLCHYDFALRLRIMADGLGLTPELIERQIYASGFDEESDEGRVGADDYLPEMGRRLGREVPLALWLEARRRAIAPDAAMLDLARALGGHLTVAMLTNNNLLLQRHFAEVFPEAAALFGEQAFFSAQFGTGKEGPAVFGKALAVLARQPGETLFIDDSASYIANARMAGLHTHRFTGLDGLHETLDRLNVSR